MNAMKMILIVSIAVTLNGCLSYTGGCAPPAARLVMHPENTEFQYALADIHQRELILSDVRYS